MTHPSSTTRILWPIVLLIGCGNDSTTNQPEDPSGDPNDFEGIEEASQGLTDLSLQCSITAGGVATLALATGDIAMVNRATASSGAILVNGYPCGTATVTTMKKLLVTGSGGAETLILDYMNGPFGVGTTTGSGIDVDLGGGTDALKIRGSKVADTYVFGASGIAINADSFKDITYANVETFVVTMSDGNDSFSGAGNTATGGAFVPSVTVFGGAGNDTLRGGAGDDILNGGDDNDTFNCGTAADGADTMNGGAGIDTVDYSGRSNPLTITIDATANDGEALEADLVATDNEIVKGGTGNDTITGSAGNDTIFGGPGDDIITGGLGNDILNGDAGNDTFLEGAATSGADTINGGAGIDTVSYALRSLPLSISLNGANVSGETGELDRIGIDVENVIGGTGDDVIVGSAADNVLDGGAGDDTISGGAGNDIIKGGAGDDTLNGDAGDDMFNEGTATSGADTIHGGTGVDTVNYSGRTNDLTVVMDGTTPSGELLEGDTIGTDVENLIGGGGDDSITGNAADNQLEGGAGVDTIDGQAGDDVIDGGLGLDIIDCGAGDADMLLDGTTASAQHCEL